MTDHKLTIESDATGFDLYSASGQRAVSVNFDRLGFDLDSEALRAWIESQRPKPLWIVKWLRARDGDVHVWAVAASRPAGKVIARFQYECDAQDFCALLNEREAQ